MKRYKSAKERRKISVRAKIKGTSQRLRLSVYRSNRYIYAQIIDDQRGNTLVAATDFDLKPDKKQATRKQEDHSKRHHKTHKNFRNAVVATPLISDLELKENNLKTERAKLVGQLLAQRALKEGIKKVVFDRGPYKYHGRVKALAQGARGEGLRF